MKYNIHELIEKYKEIYKKSIDDFFYLFVDEITSRDDFSQELKSLYDNEDIKIICSSSKATLMRDKKALLTGRTKTIEVLPLSFKEYLTFKGVIFKTYEKSKITGHFKDYLTTGGIPHYVLNKDKEYLKELIDAIIYKDIVSHYNIQNEKVIQEMFVLLCGRVGKPISYSKIARILNISVDSVKRYIKYFENSYLFYVIDRHSKSYNERVASPKKIYIGDIGIKNMITGQGSLGASFENLVFLKIKPLNPSYYLEEHIEIDFVTKDSLIEAKYDSEMTDKQEKLFKSFKKKKKVIAKGVDFFV